jgi:hypothetical protein
MIVSSKIEIVEHISDDENLRRELAGKIAHNLVMTVDWPWNDRQKWLWYVGVLADTGWYMMDALERMSLDQLQEEHRKVWNGKKTE